MNFMIKKRAQILIQPWLNSMLFKKYKSGLKKSLASLDPISPPETTSEDQQNQHSGSDRDNSIYKNNDDHLFGLKDILQNSISDNRDNFSIKLDVENKIVEVDNDHSFLLMSKSKLERSFINHINNCIDNSLQPSIGIETSIVSGIDNYSDSLFINLMVESLNSNEVSRTLSYIENSNDEISTDESSNDENSNDENSNNESSNALDNRTTRDRDYSHLWELCENCEWLNYKKFMKMNLCEQCMYHFKMKSSDRIELLIDPGTWEPMDKDMGMEYLDQNLQPLMKFEGRRPSLDKWIEEWKKRTFNLTKSVTKDSEEDSEENVEENLEEDLDFENYLNKTLKKALKHLDGGDQEALKEALKKSLKDQIKISSGMWKKTLKEAYYFYLTKEDNLEKLWWMKALRESLKEDLEHSEAFLTGMRQLVKTLEKPVKKDSEEDFDEDYKKDSQEDFLKDSRKDSDWAEREEIAREAFKEGLTEEWKEELTKFLQEELTRRRKDWNKDLKERGDEWTKRREEWEKEQREEWEKEQKEEWEKKQRLKELEALEEGEAWKQDENWKQEEGWQQKEDRKQEQDWKQEEGVKQDEDEWKKWKPNWRQELEKVWQIWHKDWIKGLKDEWKNWNPDWEKSWEEVLKKVLKKGLEGRLQETLKAESKDWNPDREKPLTEDFKEDLKQRLQKKAWVKETFENDFEERVKRIDKELTKHWKDWEEEPYPEKILSNQRKTGLIDAVQTGIGQINGIPVAIAVMDFEFIAGSMGSVVGEKITRLIEYATNQFLPLIIVCASGGARMQEGSVSLMQMAKISSALYNYQLITKLFYISILASPTTGGVTASFGMLGDIIIAEPDAYIAFAGKRVIEETLKIEVPEGVQETEYLFEKGSFDLVVPRNFLKIVLSELLKLHAFFPLNENLIKTK